MRGAAGNLPLQWATLREPHRLSSRTEASRLGFVEASLCGVDAAVKSSATTDEGTALWSAQGSVVVAAYSQRSKPLVRVSAWTGTGTTFAVSMKYELRAVH